MMEKDPGEAVSHQRVMQVWPWVRESGEDVWVGKHPTLACRVRWIWPGWRESWSQSQPPARSRMSWGRLASVLPHRVIGWEQTRGTVALAPMQPVVLPVVPGLRCILSASPVTLDVVNRVGKASLGRWYLSQDLNDTKKFTCDDLGLSRKSRGKQVQSWKAGHKYFQSRASEENGLGAES